MMRESILDGYTTRNIPKKGLGRAFAPYKHTLRYQAKIQNLSIVTPEPAKRNFWLCRMGAHTHPSPFFENFLVIGRK